MPLPNRRSPAYRQAQREYQRAWYANPLNREIHKQRVKRAKEANVKRMREVINRAKSAPCMDCGRSFDLVCMDFDHRAGETKLANVSEMARTKSWVSMKALLDEIAKCDVVCACCHRLRTKSRWVKGQASTRRVIPPPGRDSDHEQLVINFG